MKQHRLLSVLLVSAWMLFGNNVFAQLVGDCVFLQGKYVEVGVAPNGGYGTTLPAPTGYHPNPPTFTFYDPAAGTTTTSNQFLGFVADYGRDGWTVGTPPYFGDYYLPGSPQEGWAIEVGGSRSFAYIPTYQAATTTGFTAAGAAGAPLSGTCTGYSTSGGISKGVWTGNKGALAIRQTTILDTNKLYFTVNVVMTNNGASTLNNIYYMRTVDPDNDQTSSGSYNTFNTITYQLPNPGNKVLVSSTGTVSTNAYLGLGTKDCRAKCFYVDFNLLPDTTLTMSDIFNESTSFTYGVGTTTNSDVGIALMYNIGNLAPGDSTTLTYAYILNAAYIDSALTATQPAFLLNSYPIPSGTTVNLCTYGTSTATVSMGSGAFYNWSWSPTTYLTNPTGVSNVIPVASIVDMTYTVTGINVSGGCDTVMYTIRLKKDTFSIDLQNPDTIVCIGDSVQTRLTGPPLLSYSWVPSTGVSNPSIMNPKIAPSVTTTYRVYAYADTTCDTVMKQFTITVNNPNIDSINFTNPSVCGYMDGSMRLYGLETGYLDTLHYSLNGIAQPPLPVGVSSTGRILVTGLGAGVYSNIWVKVGPCPTNIVGPVTLVNPAPPTVTVDSPYVKMCVGQSMLLHSYVSSTGIPINYTWSPAAYLSTTTASNTVVAPSIGGDITYTVTVNPGTNPACNSSDTVHVHTLDLIRLNNRDTVICIGNYVQASVTGSSEYAYVWTPTTGVSAPTTQNPTITPPVTQSYSVTASYASCPDQHHHFNIEVDTPAIPRNIIDTICLGMSDSFDFTVPGTAGTGDYTYTWSTAVMSDLSNPAIANPIITPANIGTNIYSVNIHPAALNCAVNSTVTLFVIDTIVTIRPTDTFICKGKVVQAVGTAGDPLFSYQWLPTAGIPVSNVFNALITPDTSALYVLTATFGRCPPIHRTMKLEVEPNPTVYIGGNRFLCGFDTLHIDASVNPGWYSKYEYSWTPAADLDNTTTGTVVYSGTTSTKLYLTVTTDSAGCTAKDSAQITVYPGNFASISPDHYNYCPHDTTAIAVTTTAGAGVTYRWYPSRYLDDSTSPSPKIKPVGNQVYTIVATTSNGCNDTLNFSASVYPSALISVPDSVTLYPGESYHIFPLTNCTSFLWFPPAGLNAANVSDPVATPEVSTKYYVFGVTSDGCQAMDSIDVNVEPQSIIALPNAFAPGTGVNKEFKILLKGIANLNHFRIFNRWGNLLFETTDINKGWDGTFNGEPQPLGVYIYQVEAVTSSGTIFQKHGNVTLLR